MLIDTSTPAGLESAVYLLFLLLFLIHVPTIYKFCNSINIFSTTVSFVNILYVAIL